LVKVGRFSSYYLDKGICYWSLQCWSNWLQVVLSREGFKPLEPNLDNGEFGYSLLTIVQPDRQRATGYLPPRHLYSCQINNGRIRPGIGGGGKSDRRKVSAHRPRIEFNVVGINNFGVVGIDPDLLDRGQGYTCNGRDRQVECPVYFNCLVLNIESAGGVFYQFKGDRYFAVGRSIGPLAFCGSKARVFVLVTPAGQDHQEK